MITKKIIKTVFIGILFVITFFTTLKIFRFFSKKNINFVKNEIDEEILGI